MRIALIAFFVRFSANLTKFSRLLAFPPVFPVDLFSAVSSTSGSFGAYRGDGHASGTLYDTRKGVNQAHDRDFFATMEQWPHHIAIARENDNAEAYEDATVYGKLF
jgi:hypothetical protein